MALNSRYLGNIRGQLGGLGRVWGLHLTFGFWAQGFGPDLGAQVQGLGLLRFFIGDQA